MHYDYADMYVAVLSYSVQWHIINMLTNSMSSYTDYRCNLKITSTATLIHCTQRVHKQNIVAIGSVIYSCQADMLLAEQELFTKISFSLLLTIIPCNEL